MNRVKFGDIVKDVKVNVDRMNNPYEYYVAGDHMDSEDLTIHRKGRFATDDVGPAFVRIFKPGQILYGSRRTYLKKVAVADFSGICANTTFVFESKDHSIFDQRLLPFIMLSDSFTSWSISKSKGSTNPYVLFSDLADYEFDLPSLEEQKVLADKLWAAYRLKEGYKKLLCVTDEMVKSQFIEMFKNSEKIALGNMATFVNGSAFKPDDWSTEGVPIVRIQNLTQDDSTYNYYNGDMTKKVIIDSGDIIISWSATLGVFFWNRGRALLNQHIFKVLFNKVNVNKEFFVYTVRLALDEMADIAHGSTMRHIVKKDFDGTMVAYPDYEEQERFASIVKQADKSKFGDFKSQFIEMFGNPLFNTKKWRWYSNINNVVTIVLGSTPNTKEPKYWDGDIKWITPAEMDDETFMINDTLRHITEFGVKSANLTKLPVGSVLFSTRAPIGKVGIAAAEMYCNQGFKSFICSNQVDSIFLYYTLKLNKEYLCSLGTGTTFKELSKKTVEGLKLGVPPIDLQKQFAIIYKQADKSKSYVRIAFKNLESMLGYCIRQIS